MHPMELHMVAPRTAQAEKEIKKQWASACHTVFDKENVILAEDIFIYNSNCNQLSHIYCDASN